MTPDAEFTHMRLRAKDLCEAQPVEALRLGLGDSAAALMAWVPPHCRAGLVRHILFGIKPGEFLCAVLDNDLMGAVGKADEINREALPAYCQFLYNAAPAECYGSPYRTSQWRASGGYFGRGLDAAIREGSA